MIPNDYHKQQIDRLNRIMRKKGLTMYRVAKLTGLAQSTIRTVLKCKNDPKYFSTFLPIKNTIENYENHNPS